MPAASAERTCEWCGSVLVRNRKHSAKQWAAKRFCDKPCVAAASKKPRAVCACGCGEHVLPRRKYVRGHRPIKLTVNGYRRVWVGKDHPLANVDGNCLEHRLVLFNAGIDVISRGLDVHHRNGDKTDNRIENLVVLTKAEHARLHAAERRAEAA